MDPVIEGIIMINNRFFRGVGKGKGTISKCSTREVGGKEVNIKVLIRNVKTKGKMRSIPKVFVNEMLREVEDTVLPHVTELLTFGRVLEVYIMFDGVNVDVVLSFDGDGWGINVRFFHHNGRMGKYYGNNILSIFSTLREMRKMKTDLKRVEIDENDRITVDMLLDMYKNLKVKVINQETFKQLAELFIKVLETLTKMGRRVYDMIVMYILYP